MKLSFRIILPIVLISALLILLAGCFGVPSDESPGYTPGTITGIIAAPCCSTSDGPVTEPCCVYPEYWCYYCDNTWSLQKGVEVILTYGLDEVATTTTNEDGEYTFTNVPPAKNYVITALCPDYDDERPLVKDVALKVVEGKVFDAKITDCISTALGLVVDYLVENTTVLGPEEIVLDGVIAGIPNFYGFPEFKKLVERICEIAPGCVNLFEDEKVPDYLCRAAQEIGRKVIPDLDLGCAPGATNGGEGEDECVGNTAPIINSITPTTATVGVPYSGQVNVTDDGTITKYELISGPSGMIISESTGALSGWTPVCADICECPQVAEVQKSRINECTPTYVEVKVTDNCGASDEKSFCITVSSTNMAPVITSTPGTSAVVGTEYTYQIVATDTDCWNIITYSLVSGPDGMTFDGTDTIKWTPTCAQIGDHAVTVRATDNGSPALFAEQNFTITVLTNNYHKPTITPNPFGRHAVSSGKQYYYTVNGSDADGDSVTYSLLPDKTGVPKSMNIDSNGKITWNASCFYESKCHICNWVKIIVRVTDNGCGKLYYEQPLEIEIWYGKVDGNNLKPDCDLMTDGTIIIY